MKIENVLKYPEFFNRKTKNVGTKLLKMLGPDYAHMDGDQLKDLAITVINHPTYEAQLHKKKVLIQALESKSSKTEVQTLLANIGLKGEKLSLRK